MPFPTIPPRLRVTFLTILKHRVIPFLLSPFSCLSLREIPLQVLFRSSRWPPRVDFLARSIGRESARWPRDRTRALAHHSRPRSLGTGNARARDGAGGRRETGVARRHEHRARPQNEMGSLTCFSMRFDDKTPPRLNPIRSTTPRRVRTINVSTHVVDRGSPNLRRRASKTYPLLSVVDRRVLTAGTGEQLTPSKVAQLAPVKRTPVALPRISAGVSKSPKYGDAGFLLPPRDRSVNPARRESQNRRRESSFPR